MEVSNRILSNDAMYLSIMCLYIYLHINEGEVNVLGKIK